MATQFYAMTGQIMLCLHFLFCHRICVGLRMYFSITCMCTGEEDASNVKKETAALAANFCPVGAALGLPLSRKQQRSNDEGVPQPKRPHVEDGEETHLCGIVQYTHVLGFWVVGGGGTALSSQLPHNALLHAYAAIIFGLARHFIIPCVCAGGKMIGLILSIIVVEGYDPRALQIVPFCCPS
jgi:hypothetical protein